MEVVCRDDQVDMFTRYSWETTSACVDCEQSVDGQLLKTLNHRELLIC